MCPQAMPWAAPPVTTAYAQDGEFTEELNLLQCINYLSKEGRSLSRRDISVRETPQA